MRLQTWLLCHFRPTRLIATHICCNRTPDQSHSVDFEHDHNMREEKHNGPLIGSVPATGGPSVGLNRTEQSNGPIETVLHTILCPTLDSLLSPHM